LVKVFGNHTTEKETGEGRGQTKKEGAKKSSVGRVNSKKRKGVGEGRERQ